MLNRKLVIEVTEQDIQDATSFKMGWDVPASIANPIVFALKRKHKRPTFTFKGSSGKMNTFYETSSLFLRKVQATPQMKNFLSDFYSGKKVYPLTILTESIIPSLSEG